MGSYCIGLMSGTSADAVDAALCEIVGGHIDALKATHSLAYAQPLRDRLLQLQLAPEETTLTLRELAELDHAVAEAFASAAKGVLRKSGVATSDILAIGSHGQTVFHDPFATANSLQLGNPSLIAARTGIPVAADFRRADIALGGQGAPLVPAFHLDRFARLAPCAILNLGGIANLSLLDGPATDQVIGFDTGPGNGLLDSCIHERVGLSCDFDGAHAARGRIDSGLLGACLSDPYFRQAPPKSTGRDRFNLRWLRERFPAIDRLPLEDALRSLCELTARSVADQLMALRPATKAMYVCGGGVRNPVLMASLRSTLPGIAVESTLAVGLDPAWVEPAAFAWLAWRRLHGLPGNLPSVTGAHRPAVLGGIYHP